MYKKGFSKYDKGNVIYSEYIDKNKYKIQKYYSYDDLGRRLSYISVQDGHTIEQEITNYNGEFKYTCFRNKSDMIKYTITNVKTGIIIETFLYYPDGTSYHYWYDKYLRNYRSEPFDASNMVIIHSI